MTLYDVWDELNGAEENAGQFDAVDAEEAATMYASEDCDGLSDGLYSHVTHPILVRAPDGTLTRVQVYAEWDPMLTAASSELVEPEPSEEVGGG